MKNVITLNTGNQFKYLLTILAFSFVFMGCSSDKDEKSKDNESDCNNATHNGYQTIVQGSESRTYIIHVPASYNSDTPTPLVINFHGFGDCASDYAMNIGEFYNLNTLADSENFLIAYPQAIVREKKVPHGTQQNNGSQNITENDVYFVEQLIADINSTKNVDLSRVYAIGYSNGGMMSYGLACIRTDLIAAAGIMSGVMLSATCNANESTPILHFHGAADKVLPYEGDQNYQSISSIINFWLDHNNIPSSSLVTTELNDGDVVREEYTGGNENSAVVLYTINREHDKEGGHVWFSADIDGVSPNKILWDFLAQFSL